MKEPEAYGGLNGVLNTGMYLVTILYFFVGFFGYIRYGSDARGSITLNLPNDNKYITDSLPFIFYLFISIDYINSRK
jgi:proton-coupled amino acid transporter